MLKTSNNTSKVFNNIENRTKSSLASSIFNNSPDIDSSRVEYNEVPIDDIVPRPINNYSQSRIENLAKSIRSTDDRLINPIVIVKPQDLPENSEILKKYKQDNVDFSNIKYIIVAGERRYRACLLNRKLKNEELTGTSAINPYDTITANILTKEEAEHEEIYYKDSNDQSRQLTPVEGIIHIQSILTNINSDEDKRRCLVEMNGEENVVKNPKEAAKSFRLDKYILFYLSKELGIEGWEESTVRTYTKVVKSCDPTVIEAVLAGEFPSNQARKICSFPLKTQIQLLQLYKENKAKYQAALEKMNPKNQKVILKGKTVIDKELKNLNKKIDNSIKLVLPLQDELGKSDKEQLERLLKDLDTINKEIKIFLEK